MSDNSLVLRKKLKNQVITFDYIVHEDWTHYFHKKTPWYIFQMVLSKSLVSSLVLCSQGYFVEQNYRIQPYYGFMDTHSTKKILKRLGWEILSLTASGNISIIFFGLKPASHYNYFTNFRFSLSFLNLPSVQSSVALIKTIICMEIIQIPSRIMAGFGWNYVWKTFYEMHFQILVKIQHMLPEKYHRLYITLAKMMCTFRNGGESLKLTCLYDPCN